MSKYTSVTSDIFSIFASLDWQAENIKTYPENFTQSGGDVEFIRVSVIPGNPEVPGSSVNSVSGVTQIDIFVEAGKGPNRAAAIADILDSYLVGKTLVTTANGNTQFLTSTLNSMGVDKANNSLYRYKYSIPFNYFGV